MSQFIDYTKRGVTLPPGCKDLIDALRLVEQEQAREEVRSSERYGMVRGGAVKGTLSDIGKYGARVFESKADIALLFMAAPAKRLVMELIRGRDIPKIFHVRFDYDPDRISALREFCRRYRLDPPMRTGIPGHSPPHLPVQRGYVFSPVPSESGAFAGLATAWFRNFCGLDDTSELHFRFSEGIKGI